MHHRSFVIAGRSSTNSRLLPVVHDFLHLNRIQNRNNSYCRSRNWKATTWGLLCIVATRCIRASQAMSTVAGSQTTSILTSKLEKIAVGQVCSTSSKWNNLVNVAMCAGWATSVSNEQRCSMLFLPECFGFLGSNAEETLRAAEPSSTVISSNPEIVRATLVDIIHQCSTLPMNHLPKNVPTLDAINIDDEWKLSLIDGIRVIAQTSNLWISAGSIHMLCSDEVNSDDAASGRHVYNTHIIMDHTGTIRSEYRKIHLFDVCIPEKNVDLRESKTTRPGTELVVCPDTPIGT